MNLRFLAAVAAFCFCASTATADSVFPETFDDGLAGWDTTGNVTVQSSVAGTTLENAAVLNADTPGATTFMERTFEYHGGVVWFDYFYEPTDDGHTNLFVTLTGQGTSVTSDLQPEREGRFGISSHLRGDLELRFELLSYARGTPWNQPAGTGFAVIDNISAPQFTHNPVPTPSAALAGLGLMGLVGLRRRG